MQLGISNYALPTNNDVGGQCAEECGSADFKVSNFEWHTGDSFNVDDPEVVIIGGAAPTLTSGECQEGCSECREYWYASNPSPANPSYMCVDTQLY
jgi:hypothetical protein